MTFPQIDDVTADLAIGKVPLWCRSKGGGGAEDARIRSDTRSSRNAKMKERDTQSLRNACRRMGRERKRRLRRNKKK